MPKKTEMEVVIIQPGSFEALAKKLEEIDVKVNRLLSGSNSPELLTGKELCKLLKISPRTLQRYRDHRLIEFSQSGTKIFYSRSAVNKFMEANHIKLRMS